MSLVEAGTSQIEIKEGSLEEHFIQRLDDVISRRLEFERERWSYDHNFYKFDAFGLERAVLIFWFDIFDTKDESLKSIAASILEKYKEELQNLKYRDLIKTTGI